MGFFPHDKSAGQKGTAILEFAILAPFLLIFLINIYDIGALLRERTSLSRVAREGARIASKSSLTDKECSYNGSSFDEYPTPTGQPPTPCDPYSGHPSLLAKVWALASLNLECDLSSGGLIAFSKYDAVTRTARVRLVYRYSGVMIPYATVSLYTESTAAMLL